MYLGPIYFFGRGKDLFNFFGKGSDQLTTGGSVLRYTMFLVCTVLF